MNEEEYKPELCHQQIKSFKEESNFSDDRPCCANCRHADGDRYCGGLIKCTKPEHEFFVRPFGKCNHFARVGTPERMDIGQLLRAARVVGQLQFCLTQLMTVRENLNTMDRSIAEPMGEAMASLDGVFKNSLQFLKDHEEDVK